MIAPANERVSTFAHLARGAGRLTGRPTAFVAAVAFVLVWALTGPLFDWSDTWQLVINTATTIITFLMIFLLQSTQNRDTEAVQLKLDELIRAIDSARNSMVGIEALDEKELERLQRGFDEFAARARRKENGPSAPQEE